VQIVIKTIGMHESVLYCQCVRVYICDVHACLCVFAHVCVCVYMRVSIRVCTRA
jgi:hypothetical protein